MASTMEAGGSHEAPATADDAVALVLNNRDLLGDILLRLAFPADLVHVALACKFWLGVASDPVFLRRFGDLHPPRLLGFFATANYKWCNRLEFWPVRHPLELASVVRRAASIFDGDLPSRAIGINDCRGGHLVLRLSQDGYTTKELAVLSLAGGNASILPPPPPIPFELERPCVRRHRMVLPDHGCDGQCFDLAVAYCDGEPHRTVQVSEFKHGVWCIRASLKTELLKSPVIPKVLVVGDRFYMATQHNIVVLDLTSSSFAAIDYPEPIDDDFTGGRLSRADDESGVYMVNVDSDNKLRVWLHRAGSWLLVDAIRVRKVFARVGIRVPCTGFKVSCVGDGGEFVLLEMDGRAFYVDIPSRAVEAVLKVAKGKDLCYGGYGNAAWPFMTIWPPRFPNNNRDG
ncbi:unnamed protein product [Urochloa decumbens]|uniref:F-box protein AT5G49610-like beta-propeller domain-containing protein n=1 Tax=Urochloa decumbens TaxID=240449 RepID=A0ABC8VD15_9POAL